MKRETYLAALEEAFANGDAVRPADFARLRADLAEARQALARWGAFASRTGLSPASHQGEPTEGERHIHTGRPHRGKAFALHDGLSPHLHDAGEPTDRCPTCGRDYSAFGADSFTCSDPWHSGEPTEEYDLDTRA